MLINGQEAAAVVGAHCAPAVAYILQYMFMSPQHPPPPHSLRGLAHLAR